MLLKKTAKITLLFLTFFILYFFYYYLPSQNKGVIEVDKAEIQKIQNNEKTEGKNTFVNTEYKNQSNNGQIFTTRAKESFIFQGSPDLIQLIEPYSFTTMKKDQSLIEISSKSGLFDKAKKITSYEKNVVIKNKNYLITANLAKHFSERNMIIIDGNVVMKDLTFGLSHVLYCDTAEIDTITNNTTLYMKYEKDKVIAKKYR